MKRASRRSGRRGSEAPAGGRGWVTLPRIVLFAVLTSLVTFFSWLGGVGGFLDGVLRVRELVDADYRAQRQFERFKSEESSRLRERFPYGFLLFAGTSPTLELGPYVQGPEYFDLNISTVRLPVVSDSVVVLRIPDLRIRKQNSVLTNSNVELRRHAGSKYEVSTVHFVMEAVVLMATKDFTVVALGFYPSNSGIQL